MILTTDESHLNVNQTETEPGYPLIVLLSIFLSLIVLLEHVDK